MIIYFFPFQMNENDIFLEDEIKYQRMKNKECFGVRASDKTPLCFLKTGDILYIVAHGNTSVIGTGSRTGPTLSPGALATQLIQRRLPKSFKDLRVLSCSSGVHSKTPAFAQRLKEIMHGMAITIDSYRISWRNRCIERLEIKNNSDMEFIPRRKRYYTCK
ncbi:Uncharacterised protein [Streptococcus pneumoniae]|nr:Uncharacterised protein [Streptococcus pneumoniae]